MFEDLKLESKKIQFGLVENQVPNDITPEDLAPEATVNMDNGEDVLPF